MSKGRVFKGLFVLVAILSAYYAVKIFSEIKKDSMLGDSPTPATISFSGHGEVQAAPDIANVYLTISKDAKTVKDAQAAVATVEKSALDFLKKNDVDSKDIKTQDASFSPKYEYRNAICPQAGAVSSQPNMISSPIYCPPGKSVVVGYTASESISVKIKDIKDTDRVGTIIQGLGTIGITDLSGPNYAIDKEDDLKAQARKMAIDDAKAKAKSLAKDLGVSLGKIESFNESGNYPMPAYAGTMAMDSLQKSSAPAVLPAGENTISSDVTITYEIK